jgi:tetratricopeptide (TPR) repeat protein
VVWVKWKAIALVGLAVITQAAPITAAPVIIEGVPRIGWATGKYSYHIAAVQAALSAMGRDVSYEYLMLASGAGFRAAWRVAKYDYAATCIYHPGEDCVIMAAEAAGARGKRVAFAGADEAYRAICESIGRGIPVIAWEDCGTQVICGYDPANRQMHVQSCNSATAEYEVRPFEIPPPPPPFRQPNEVVLFTGPLAAAPPELDWAAILSRAIRFADHPPASRLYGDYVFGLAAYEAWSQTLQGGTGNLDPAIAAAVTVTYANTLADARTAVSAALTENAALHEAFVEAADHYRAEAAALKVIPGLLTPLNDDLSWEQRTKLMGERLASPAVRGEIVRTVEQATQEETAALDALRRALADFAPRPPSQLAPGGQAPQEAQEQYEQGLRLKQAGRHAEAAEHLRAALQADPDHVDAHWVLAWVLIELKDTDGAAKELRKVIELAPGSDKATGAQQALERLGQ